MNIIAAFPVQAYLFARLISLFSYYGEYLHDQTQFWCLMTVALAVGVGLCYFMLGWACNTVSFVSCPRSPTAAAGGSYHALNDSLRLTTL
jgi:hypothetical protein